MVLTYFHNFEYFHRVKFKFSISGKRLRKTEIEKRKNASEFRKMENRKTQACVVIMYVNKVHGDPENKTSGTSLVKDAFHYFNLT